MDPIKKIQKYTLHLLTKQIAQDNIDGLLKIINQIPLVKYTPEQILAENKEERIFYGKWEHSLILFDDKNPIGIIIGYERKKENNVQYPKDSIYISELGISQDYQQRGLGRELLDAFLDFNKKIGFIHLDDKLSFSVQTNSADFNRHVIDLYSSLGFRQISSKRYDNRLDSVLFLDP